MAVSAPVPSATVASNTQLFSTGRISTAWTRPSTAALRAAPSAPMAVTPLEEAPLGARAGGGGRKPAGPRPAGPVAAGCSFSVA